MDTIKYSVVELNHNEMLLVDGGGLLTDLTDAIKAVGHAAGYYIGYASGAIKDAIVSHGTDVAASNGAAASLAYK